MDIPGLVKELNFPEGSYAVFGSGPLAIRGLREARDIDIIVTTELFNEIAKDPHWKLGKVRDGHRSLSQGEISLFDTWAPGSWDVYELIHNAEMVDGVPYVKLSSVIEWKMIRNSPKDIVDIDLIHEYLKVNSK